MNTDDILLVSSGNAGGLCVIGGSLIFQIDDLITTGVHASGDFIARVFKKDEEEGINFYLNGIKKSFILSGRANDIHDILFHENKLYFVATNQNEILSMSLDGKIQSIKKYPGEQDSMHINCIDVWDGRLIASAFCESQVTHEYVSNYINKGFIFDVETGEKIWTNLSHPHTPFCDKGVKYVCNSALKQLLINNRGEIQTLQFEDYTRGLAISDNYIYVGLSQSRNIKDHLGMLAKIIVLDKVGLNIINEISLPFLEVYGIKIINKKDDYLLKISHLFDDHRINLEAKIEAQLKEKLAAREARLAQETVANELSNDIHRIKSSLSWQITKPLRFMVNLFSRKK